MRTPKDVMKTMPAKRRRKIGKKAKRIIAKVDRAREEARKEFSRYPDAPLGKQIRKLEDVPSLHKVVSDHFQGKSKK